MSQSKKEKKANPILEFFQRWVLEPLDNLSYAWRMVLKEMGISDHLDYAFAQGIEDPVFFTILTQLCDYTVYNWEVIPESGAAIIASNHQSFLDAITNGMTALHYRKRLPYELSKAELWADPTTNIFTRANRGIYVRRGESDELAMEECRRVLNDGHLLIVYPEGTIGDGNGKMLPFKSGVTRLAFDCNLPIIPVATYGIDKVYGKGMKIPKKGKIHIKFGEPIPYDKLFKKRDENGQPDFAKATKLVQRKVQELWTELWTQDQQNNEV